MNRKLNKVWLFLSVLGIVLLPPESSTTGDEVSRSNYKKSSGLKDDSDPKPENTGETDPSRGDPNSLNFKDESGKFPRGPVYNIPQNEMEFTEQTKDLRCKPGQKAMYVLHPQKKQTYIGCYKDKPIHGYCPEFNGKGLQPKHDASCKICNATYKASEGYKFRKCFEIYGGISSPKERELGTCTCNIPASTPFLKEPFVIFLIVFVLILIVIIVILILYIKRDYFKKRCWREKEPNKTIIPLTQISRDAT